MIALLWALGATYLVLAVVFSAAVLVRKRDPAVTLAWVLAFFLLPFAGVVAFAFFGYQRFRLRRRRIPNPVHRLAALPDPAGAVPPAFQGIERLAERLTGFPVTAGNRVAVFSRSEETDQALVRALREARRHVHMSYYIFEPDSTGIFFRDLLIECAARGVQCRLLMDAVGSFNVGSDFLAPLEAAGVRAAFFSPFQSFKRPWALNFRNHRKLSVIDGATGFVGSQNIGHNFWRAGSRRLSWRETDLRLEGPAVAELQTVFAEDWHFATGENLTGNSYYPAPERPGSTACQVLPTGPHGRENALGLIFLEAVYCARERVTVTTPYFIPTPAMALALEGAARRGVRVDILLPRQTDHPVVTWAGRSWYEEFIENGVRIHEYGETFVHSKVVTVDGKMALVGSANMDTRSFLINFELSLLQYDQELTGRLVEEFDAMAERADPVSLRAVTRQSFWRNLAEGTCRVFSPLL